MGRNEVIPNYLYREGSSYELRFMASSNESGDDYSWDGKIYSCHGGFWKGVKKIIQSNNGGYGNIPHRELDISLYVY